MLTLIWNEQILNKVFLLGKDNSLLIAFSIKLIFSTSSININPPPTDDMILAGDSDPIAAIPKEPAFLL